MANTKKSVAREIIIDRLLRDRRGYTAAEIAEKVNASLEIDGFKKVSVATIRVDIENFRNLYKQKIEVKRRSYSLYYRYEDKNTTVYNNVLTFGEIKHLQSALQSIRFLDPIQGALIYQQLFERLRKLLKMDSVDNPFLIYETIPDEHELKTFKSVYNFIYTKTTALIRYKPRGSKEIEIIAFPYFLRQRKYKWSLLCHDATNKKPAEIPLSSIIQVKKYDAVDFLPNVDFPLKDYYKGRISMKNSL